MIILFPALVFLNEFYTNAQFINQLQNAKPAKQLSNKDRVEMFEEIWKTINDNYADPTFGGIDWQAARDRYRPRIEMANDDREFSVVLEEMIADLSPQGRKVDRVGVIPDKIVPLTLGDLKVQRDTMLEEAVKTLESLQRPQDGKK